MRAKLDTAGGTFDQSVAGLPRPAISTTVAFVEPALPSQSMDKPRSPMLIIRSFPRHAVSETASRQVLLRNMTRRTLETFKKALKHKNLKIVWGTVANAGAHGQNYREFIVRVRNGGQDQCRR